ncbi:non-ribosomal peptide synthetase module [Paenibacillus sp. CAA11]|uniref:non-ribosomal peptide synthetase module n=1 Tax=Paenibacillus sp. CAA11 TaxID=1532905 RepID=UPI000D368563|nr:non-ribosomal peptide synthetase module [Paenibacillus sp. CAA11]AWB45740.1 non-ribosomal peptide synthetase module [Paenibacillus sp. CAA11]
MAKRIATEYVEASMRLSEAQLNEFVHRVNDPQVHQMVKVLDGGGQVVVLADEQGEEVQLSFDIKDGAYVCELSFRLRSLKLTNVVRRMFSECKGSGRVNRIYEGFTMVYVYEEGQVIRIMEESQPEACNLIYEHKDTMGQLTRMFKRNGVEMEILGIHQSINALLDLRIASVEPETVKWIDDELRLKTKRLFALEA